MGQRARGRGWGLTASSGLPRFAVKAVGGPRELLATGEQKPRWGPLHRACAPDGPLPSPSLGSVPDFFSPVLPPLYLQFSPKTDKPRCCSQANLT